MSKLEHTQSHHQPSWFTYIRPRRFQFLLIIQLLFIMIAPLLGQDIVGRAFTAVVSSLAFVQTCVSIIPRKRVLFIGGTLAFLLSALSSLVLIVDTEPFNHFGFQAGARIVAILFYAFAATIIFRDVIRAGDVDVNKLCGAVCLYLLIGILWGQFYQLAEVLDPGSFHLDLTKMESHGPITHFEKANLLNYFSYVTLSTLGYGDISPISRLTRTLAWSEALLGQIYMAILVSRLVGLHIASSSVSSDE
ncbi:MAG: potassium channel family protein [Candidatus Obscuribacterales bacterium]|nr:potassium channel family protein [Candidatus Obscuribacterales bacterium]